jgi:hypothetical protein
MLKCASDKCKTFASVTHNKSHYCSMCYIKSMGLINKYLAARANAETKSKA